MVGQMVTGLAGGWLSGTMVSTVTVLFDTVYTHLTFLAASRPTFIADAQIQLCTPRTAELWIPLQCC